MAKKLSQYDAILNASENTVIPILENGVNKKISADNLLKKNVINSLSSTEILKSLSAAQGKTLKDALDTLTTTVGNKQDSLVSGTNIKTINNATILGAGNITIEASGSGLGGTNYVFVRGDGTPQENAIELQAKYNEAKSMPRYLGIVSFGTTSTWYEGQTFKDSANAIWYKFTETYTGLIGTNQNKMISITEAEAISNRATVVVAPGQYNFGEVAFKHNTKGIDIVSLTGNADVFLDSTEKSGDGYIFSISITADYSKVKGINTGTKAIEVGGNWAFANLPNLICDTCIGGNYSFGGGGGTASGIFSNCTGGEGSFGGYGGTASGTFNNCTGGDYSFGSGGIASGTFNNCIGGNDSFGGNGTASGTFNYCTAGYYAFGSGGTALGTFNNCIAGDDSFGGNGTASGTFNNCTAGIYSFGSSGVASGTFNNCIGGEYSFGGFGGELSSTVRLYYCKLTTGTFETPAVGGKLVLCIDGTDAIITTT